MKRFSVSKISLILMAYTLVMMVSIAPVTYAEDNVLFCMENKDKCNEDGTSIIEKNEDEEESPTADKTESQEPKVGLSAWDYIKTLFALVFVVGLLFALLKFVNRKNRMYDKTRFMKNMGGLSLGQNKSIQLVVVGDTYYLIGVGEDIRLLKEITDNDEIATLMEHYDEVDVSSTKGLLEQILTKIPNKKKDANQPGNQTTDFSNIFNTRLDEIKEERKRHISQLTEKERKHDE